MFSQSLYTWLMIIININNQSYVYSIMASGGSNSFLLNSNDNCEAGQSFRIFGNREADKAEMLNKCFQKQKKHFGHYAGRVGC